MALHPSPSHSSHSGHGKAVRPTTTTAGSVHSNIRRTAPYRRSQDMYRHSQGYHRCLHILTIHENSRDNHTVCVEGGVREFWGAPGLLYFLKTAKTQCSS